MRGNPQPNYDVNLSPWLDGSVIDNRTKVAEDHVAIEEIGFGKALFSAGSEGSVPGLYPNSPVQLPKRNVAALVMSGDLVTSNVVNGKLNGVAIAPVTFATNNLTTMTAVGAAGVAALATLGITATPVLSNSNNTITWTAGNATITLSEWVVTAGSGQATATYTYTTSYVFRGVSPWVQKQLTLAGNAGYDASEMIGAIRRGLIAVRARGGAITEDAPVYACIATAGDEGGFTATSTGNGSIVGVARSAAADDALFLLELNAPQY